MIAGLLFDSWSFYKKHILVMLVLTLPIIVPVGILTSLLQHSFDDQNREWLIWVVDFMAYPVYAVAIVYYIASIISGEYTSPKTLWLLGVKYWLPFMLLTILSSIAIVLGLALLIIPGIIISIRLAFSQFELLLNHQQPLDAMRVSWDKTKDHMWILFAGYFVITVLIYFPYFAISYLLGKMEISFWMVDFLVNIVFTLADIFYVIFAFRVYEFAKLKDELGR